MESGIMYFKYDDMQYICTGYRVDDATDTRVERYRLFNAFKVRRKPTLDEANAFYTLQEPEAVHTLLIADVKNITIEDVEFTTLDYNEILHLFCDRRLQVEDVIDAVIDANAFVGVGLITLGEHLQDYVVNNRVARRKRIEERERKESRRAGLSHSDKFGAEI